MDPTNAGSVPSADLLAHLGATRVRLEFKVVDAAGESSANADAALARSFAVYDDILSTYRARGTHALLLLDYQTLPRPKANAPAGAWKTYVTQFAARAGKIAKRYDATAFEIWNEEDFCESSSYCPRVEPGDYAALFGPAAHAIHTARPSATVITGGMGGGTWDSYIQQVRAAMGSDWNEVDGVGAHPYTFWPKAKTGNKLEWQIEELSRVTGRPIHMTEWGGDGKEAEMIDAYFAFFRDPASRATTQKIAQAYLFGWSDAMKPGHAFGVVDAQGRQKPAFARFQAGAHGS